MATSFKELQSSDIQSVQTKLHEAIPLTGTIVSGTYNDQNIKNYSHGMFTSIFDYPFLSSSANHLYDITVGINPAGALSSTLVAQKTQKFQIYQQMAQVLVGNDATGSIRPFDKDGDLTTGDKFDDAIFLDFSRLLTKDEIKKGTFKMEVSVQPTGSGAFMSASMSVTTNVVLIQDVSGSDSFKTNSPAGEYNLLYITGSTSGTIGGGADSGYSPAAFGNKPCGLIYYQAGIVVLTSSMLKVEQSGGLLSRNLTGYGTAAANDGGKIVVNSGSYFNMQEQIVSGSISGSAAALTNRIQNIEFQNTTDLNSTVYFCRAASNEFNYSANPTYLSMSQVRVKEIRSDEPISYITTVGLYGDDNELLAVAKLSEPLKKTPSNEFTLRVRLDY
mgnify:CR=1 FL=1